MFILLLVVVVLFLCLCILPEAGIFERAEATNLASMCRFD